MKKKSSLVIVAIIILLAVLLGVLLAGNKTVAPPAAPQTASNATVQPVAGCVTHGNLGMHIHPTLEIRIDGQAVAIPANIGITEDCMQSLHTHDTSGKIHVESAEIRNFTLKDFFAVWGQPFSKDHILDNKGDAEYVVVLRVDGQKSDAYENLVLKDGQKISISLERR